MNRPMPRMRAFLLGLLMCTAMHGAVAEMTAAEAMQKGKEDGGETKRQQIFDKINVGTGGDVIKNFSPSAPPQSGYWTGNTSSFAPITSAGTSKVGECATTGTTNPDKTAAQHCEAVNAVMDTHNNKPPNMLNQNDPLILKGHEITANPEAILGNMLGSYTNCTEATTGTGASFEFETCEEWSESVTATCSMGLEVTVDPDYLYSCVKTLATINSASCTYGRVVKVDTDYNYQCTVSSGKVNTYTCNRTLNINCTNPTTADGCDTGGIVPGSAEADMQLLFQPVGGGTYGILYGVLSDNYWNGYVKAFDRKLTFSIANKSEITQFQLVQVAYNAAVQIKINGTRIFAPLGGNRLEVCYRSYDYQEYTYWDQAICWTETDYCIGGQCPHDSTVNAFPNIDLRPYLQNGQNTVEMRTIVVGAGNGALLIHARMACPKVCTEEWDNGCATLEARAK